MDNRTHYACIDRFYEDYFQQKIVSKRFVSKHNPHNRILEFATGQKWVGKIISRQNWTGGKRCREDIEYTEHISSKVSQYLKATVTAMRWGEGQAVVPYFKDWHLLFPFVNGVSIKQWQSLHAFELGKLLALIHQLPLSRERASVFPKLRASWHHPAFIQQDIRLCNEAYLYRLDEFVVSHC